MRVSPPSSAPVKSCQAAEGVESSPQRLELFLKNRNPREKRGRERVLVVLRLSLCSLCTHRIRMLYNLYRSTRVVANERPRVALS